MLWDRRQTFIKNASAKQPFKAKKKVRKTDGLFSSTHNKVESAVNDLMMAVSKQTRSAPYRKEFRASSLPFCPIRSFLELDQFTENYSMDFYTTIGTAIHNVMQKWSPKTDYWRRCFGVWKCTECNHETEPKLKPEVCPSCKVHHERLTYEEITIAYEGLSGHVDFVYHIGNNQYIVLDFKTTSLYEKKQKFPRDWKDKYPSSKVYEVQISTYAALLRELFGLNIVATVLIFVDRNGPIKTEDTYYPYVVEWTEKDHNKYMDLIHRACDGNDVLQELIQAVDGADDFDATALKLLKEMVMVRPCTTNKEYNEYMDKKFFTGCCPLKDACLAGNKACYQEVKRQLLKQREPPW